MKIVDYLGIEKGDTILVSSDLLNLFSKEFETTGNLPDVNKFIDLQKITTNLATKTQNNFKGEVNLLANNIIHINISIQI